MKVNFEVGYTKTNVFTNYKYWSRKNLAGVDVKIIDGNKNKIIIGSREGGSRIEVNGKVIQEIGD